MKHKIKYKLGIIPQDGEYVVHFQVLEQDERFISQGPCLIHEAANGILVESVGQPELLDGQVFLRGEHAKYDDQVVTLAFAQERDALDYVVKVRAALDDWAANWPGFSPVAELPIFTA